MSLINGFPSGSGVKINGIVESFLVGGNKEIEKNNFVDISFDGLLSNSYANTSVSYAPATLKAVALGDNKVLAIWRQSSGANLYAAVISTTGSTMSIGTITTVSTISNSDMDPGATMTAIAAISPTKVCIIFGGYDSAYRVFGVVLSISGSTITVGTTTVLNSAATTYIALDALNESRIVTIINNGSNSAGHIVSLWSISGMSMSWKVNKTNLFGSPANASSFILRRIDESSFLASALIYASSAWKVVYNKVTITDDAIIGTSTPFDIPSGFLATERLRIVKPISNGRVFVAQSTPSLSYMGIFDVAENGELRNGTVYTKQEDGLTDYPLFAYSPTWGSPYRMDDYLIILTGVSTSGNVLRLIVLDLSTRIPKVIFHTQTASYSFLNSSNTTSSVNALENGKVFCIYAGYNPGGIAKIVFDCERKATRFGFSLKSVYSNGVALDSGSPGNRIRVVSGK